MNLKIVRITAPALLLIMAKGCLHVGDGPGEIVPLPKRSDGVSNIQIVRESRMLGAAVSMYVTVDGTDVWKLRNGKSIEFGLEPGEYEIGVRCASSNAPGLLEWTHNTVEVTISSANRLNLEVSSMRCAITF